MPKFTPVQQNQAPQIESWDVEFSKEDWDEFRQGPHAFLKRITEAEGRPTDRILVDASLTGFQVTPDGDICRGQLSHHYIRVNGQQVIVYTCSGMWG